MNTEPVHDAVFRPLGGLLPNVQVVKVPDAGHGVHRDNPALFNKLALKFIEDTRAAAIKATAPASA